MEGKGEKAARYECISLPETQIKHFNKPFAFRGENFLVTLQVALKVKEWKDKKVKKWLTPNNLLTR